MIIVILPELSKILKAINYDELPELTIDKAKDTILNFLATGLAAADSPLVRAEGSVWEAAGGAGDCVIIGNKGRVSQLAAASVNALMGQVYLLEDCHEHTLSHPGVVAIPVALALGQRENAAGKRIIEAVVAGYEAIGRIGSVLIAPGFPGFGLRPASTLAPFGGAAAAAVILGLDGQKMSDALAIAGNTASGVMEFVNSGADDICLQNCYAAKNSVMATMLASKGVAGSATILDGQFGLGRAMNQRELDWSIALKHEPGRYMIDESFIKRYPGCGHVLATAQAATSLRDKHIITPDDIESVTLGVSQRAKDFPGVDNQGPFSGPISAMMSHQFVVASVFVHGEVSARTVDLFDHPGVASLAKRIYVEFDEKVDKAFPQKTGARLKMRLSNGDELVDFQEDILPLSRVEVIDRFKGSAGRYFTGGQIEDIIDKTMNIESLESINELMDLLEPN